MGKFGPRWNVGSYLDGPPPEWTLLIIGIVYVFFETTSVMMQVSYFKLTGGKRIFRMTPCITSDLEDCLVKEILGASGRLISSLGVGLLASLLTLAFLYLL